MGDIRDKNGKKPRTSTCSGLCWFFSKRVARGNQGNIMQMGGTFVVDPKGKILY